MAGGSAPEVNDWQTVEHPSVNDWQDVKPEPKKEIGTEPASISGTASVMSDQARRAASAAWDSLSSIPSALLHPVDALHKAFNYTAEAIGRVKKATSAGDAKAAVLGTLGSIPLVGPPAEQIASEIDQGKYPEAIGHAAALRIMGETPGLTGKLPAAGRAIGEVAGQPGTMPLIAGAGEVAAAPVALTYGHPFVAAGSLARGIQNLKKGFAARAAARTPASITPSTPPGVTNPADVVPREPQFAEMPPTPAARPFVVAPRAAPPIRPPDVIPREPQFEEMPPLRPPSALPEAPAPEAVVNTKALDDIAKSMAGKPYEKLSETSKAGVRAIADRMNMAASPVATAPTPTGPAAAAQALAEETGQSGTIPFSAPKYVKADQAAGRSSLEPEGFKIDARAQRSQTARTLADSLAGKIPAFHLNAMNDAGWDSLARSNPELNIPSGKGPRQKLLEETIFELRRRERAAQPAQALQTELAK